MYTTRALSSRDVLNVDHTRYQVVMDGSQAILQRFCLDSPIRTAPLRRSGFFREPFLSKCYFAMVAILANYLAKTINSSILDIKKYLTNSGILIIKKNKKQFANLGILIIKKINNSRILDISWMILRFLLQFSS